MKHTSTSPYSATVTRQVGAGPQQTFTVIVPINLSTIFTGYWFLPAVKDVRDYPGRWDEAGLSRTPIFSDGNSAHETLVTHTPPSSFSYEIRDFTGVFGRLVEAAHGVWYFEPAPDGGTTVSWTYTFTPRAFFGPLIRYAILPLWSRYMARALRLACDEVMSVS
ncbi:MAG TPA: SRPBCC family protein [Candidatus Saccharimonadia bacterium]